MQKMFARFVENESGATAIEYGLIASLIGVAIIASLNVVAGNLSVLFTAIGATL